MGGNSADSSAQLINIEYHVAIFDVLEQLLLGIDALLMDSGPVLVRYDLSFADLLLGDAILLIDLAQIIDG